MKVDILVDAERRYPMLKKCQPEGINEEILCGTLMVFEDNIQKGKMIPINVYLFPRYKLNPELRLFIDYNGGPASPNENLISYYEKGGYSHTIRDLADVLIFDQRGTGASEIPCSEYIKQQFNSHLFEISKIKSCLKEIGNSIDLSLYNSGNSVDDIEDVRAWLGINKIDFHGMSYGTRIGLEYMRRYPKNVSSLILTGTVSPNFGYATFLDLEVEKQLYKLINRCNQDSICNAKFPEFNSQIFKIRDKLRVEPIFVSLENHQNDSLEIKVTDKIFQRLVGQLFLSGNKMERIPLYVNEAYKGNFIPLLEEDQRSISRIMSVYMSTFCPEDINNNTVNEELLKYTFTEGEMGLMEVNACNEWPSFPTPNWLSLPLRGEAPVLLLTGEDDTQTPPRMAEKVKNQLPNARHLVFPNQGHSWTDYSCWDKLVYEFLEKRNLSTLDTSCIHKIKRPEFKLNLNE